MSQQPHPFFPNGYVWVRLKPVHPTLGPRNGLYLKRLFALNQVWIGGDGITVVPRWYQVQPGVAAYLSTFHQRDGDPRSPKAFDFVLDDEIKAQIDMAEAYNRQAAMGVGMLAPLAGAQMAALTPGALQLQPAPQMSAEEVARQTAGMSAESLRGAFGQNTVTPGSERFFQAVGGGVPVHSPMVPAAPQLPMPPAPTWPGVPAAPVAPPALPFTPIGLPSVLSTPVIPGATGYDTRAPVPPVQPVAQLQQVQLPPLPMGSPQVQGFNVPGAQVLAVPGRAAALRPVEAEPIAAPVAAPAVLPAAPAVAPSALVTQGSAQAPDATDQIFGQPGADLGAVAGLPQAAQATPDELLHVASLLGEAAPAPAAAAPAAAALPALPVTAPAAAPPPAVASGVPSAAPRRRGRGGSRQ